MSEQGPIFVRVGETRIPQALRPDFVCPDNSPLLKAAANGTLEEVIELLKTEDPNTAHPQNLTPAIAVALYRALYREGKEESLQTDGFQIAKAIVAHPDFDLAKNVENIKWRYFEWSDESNDIYRANPEKTEIGDAILDSLKEMLPPAEQQASFENANAVPRQFRTHVIRNVGDGSPDPAP